MLASSLREKSSKQAEHATRRPRRAEARRSEARHVGNRVGAPRQLQVRVGGTARGTPRAEPSRAESESESKSHRSSSKFHFHSILFHSILFCFTLHSTPLGAAPLRCVPLRQTSLCALSNFAHLTQSATAVFFYFYFLFRIMYNCTVHARRACTCKLACSGHTELGSFQCIHTGCGSSQFIRLSLLTCCWFDYAISCYRFTRITVACTVHHNSFIILTSVSFISRKAVHSTHFQLCSCLVLIFTVLYDYVHCAEAEFREAVDLLFHLTKTASAM